METEESNKLIAEFLGWKYNSKKTVITYPFDDDNEFYGIHHKVSNLHFHRDWNWLMEVVEKIEKLDCREFSYSWESEGETMWNFYFPTVEIIGDNCEIYFDLTLDPPMTIADEQEETKMEAIYKAVVVFIEWYNKQKDER